MTGVIRTPSYLRLDVQDGHDHQVRMLKEATVRGAQHDHQVRMLKEATVRGARY